MFLSFFVSFLIILLDQLTKFAAQRFLSLGNSVPLIKGIFHLTLTYNKGAAFSILRGATAFFIFISLFCIVVVILMLCRPKLLKGILGFEPTDVWIKVSLGLILGGACGNLIDRMRLSSVVDFLDFRIWPVFNLADSAITIGGILICYRMLACKNMKKGEA